MSMYNVNCSVPKTLVKFLVQYVADEKQHYEKTNDLYKCLTGIVKTTISPELLPAGKDGEIVQSTEDVLGPYELHDFFLPLFVRCGFSPEKILYLSDYAEFSKTYSREFRAKTLKTFIKRFFNNQFKRSCVPDGPKVGSVSLSPRGDWRMPSDASPKLWLENL
jgi:NAD+ synthase (glutamine-hydrolysing)